MFDYSLKTIVMGGKVLALGALLGTTALAQTSTDTVIVPEAAVEAGAGLGVIGDSAPRTLEQMDNDEAIAETLVAQGFEDIYILREGAILTVTANRDGEKIELVYSIANGTLMSINGQEIGPDDSDTSVSSDDVNVTSDLPDTATAGVGTGEAAETDDDSAEPGEDTGTEGEAGTEGESDTDSGTDGESDGGTDGGTDDGADGGTDGGADSGSDGGTEGGDSTGGETDSNG